MVEQPSRTVTLVFTDIEGSTRLLHEFGQDAYRDALAEHRRLVRQAFAGFRHRHLSGSIGWMKCSRRPWKAACLSSGRS
jgi:class 3 adenylate cyclase